MKFHFHILPLLSAAIAMLCCGCTQKALDWPGEQPEGFELEVKFDWKYASEANPAGMTLWFRADTRDAKIWRYDIAGRDGGRVWLPPGNYSLVAVNNDLPGIAYPSLTRGPELLVKCITLNSNDICMPSGILYEAIDAGVSISQDNSAIIAYPRQASVRYSIDIEKIEAPSPVVKCAGRISGGAQSLNLDSCEPVGPEISNIISAGIFTLPEGKGQSVKASTSGFQSPTPSSPEYKLHLSFNDEGGYAATKEIDVTQTVVSAPDPWNVEIHIPYLKIDEFQPPDGSVGGIGVSVGGWENVDLYL